VSTIAGSEFTSGTADGVGALAQFNSPQGMAIDGNNLYVADSGLIRRIVLTTNTVTTLAGDPAMPGTADGIGSAAQFLSATDLTLDGLGNLYVADAEGHTIRRVVISTKEVTTVAGTAGINGSSDGIGAAARFNSPQSLTADGAGNVFIADMNNRTVRQLNLSTKAVTTFVGTAGAAVISLGPLPARLNRPSGVKILSMNQLLITDSAENTILIVR
jgi:hypothetical protein